MKEQLKNVKGITLIALVITIIVLLILAGVAIATLTGENGVLSKAAKAQSEQADTTVKEAIALAWNEYQIEINDSTGGIFENKTKIASTKQVKIQAKEEKYLATPTMSFWDFLKDKKGYIDEDGVINVKVLTGQTLSKGNGMDGVTDIYKIEVETDTYILKYYGEENEETILWTATTVSNGDSSSTYPEATPEDEFKYIETENTITINNINTYRQNGLYCIEYYTDSEDEVNIVIPKTINNKEVVELKSADGFFTISNLKTITIPYSVKKISSLIFYYTPYLTTISFPEGVNPELEIPDGKWGANASVQIIGQNGEILK